MGEMFDFEKKIVDRYKETGKVPRDLQHIVEMHPDTMDDFDCNKIRDVEDLKLSRRVVNALGRHDIHTIPDLIIAIEESLATPRNFLLSLENMGPKSTDEVLELYEDITGDYPPKYNILINIINKFLDFTHLGSAFSLIYVSDWDWETHVISNFGEEYDEIDFILDSIDELKTNNPVEWRKYWTHVE